jgi:nitrous oxidase accessory protein NosD
MSDVRATERLLEVIADCARAIIEGNDLAGRHAGMILDITTELQRRGDTLIGREDLRTALRHVDPLGDDPALSPALERLDRALGG